ncbi:MAG: dihydrolipoyl dehydrogenase [Pseudomonadota bacterium]
MADSIKTQLLIIGGGPGGYVAGIRAGQLGLDTVLVEAGALGGCCLNVGCIPSKALIHAADEFHRVSQMDEGSPIGISTSAPSIDLSATVSWKDGIVRRLNQGVGGLLKKAKVKTLNGWAEMIDGKTAKVTAADGSRTDVRADYVVLATGSEVVPLPGLPFGGDVLSSTEALSLDDVPASIAVVGGGYIGVELGTAFAKLGAKVTIVEAGPALLPSYDPSLTAPVVKRLKALGVTVRLEAMASGFEGGRLSVRSGDDDSHIDAEKVLVTVGRRPRTGGWGLEELGLAMDGPFIAVNSRCRTSMSGVYAIGDVTGNPMLAHRAMAQGEMVAEIIAGDRREWDKRAIPEICFTDPELVQVGLSERSARAQGYDVEVGQFPFLANGRSMTMEDEAGFIRVVAQAGSSLILGIEAVGAGVSELSAQFALALEMGARLQDLAGTIHGHPTKSEAVQEAALMALGHALHA